MFWFQFLFVSDERCQASSSLNSGQTCTAGPSGSPDCKSLEPRDNVIIRLNDSLDLFLHRCMESGLQYRYQASWASILEVIKVTFEVGLA